MNSSRGLTGCSELRLDLKTSLTRKCRASQIGQAKVPAATEAAWSSSPQLVQLQWLSLLIWNLLLKAKNRATNSQVTPVPCLSSSSYPIPRIRSSLSTQKSRMPQKTCPRKSTLWPSSSKMTGRLCLKPYIRAWFSRDTPGSRSYLRQSLGICAKCTSTSSIAWPPTIKPRNTRNPRHTWRN